ncbi:AI-2E family transporter [soil metagenome]
MSQSDDELFKTLSKVLLLAAALVTLLWFIYEIQRVLLLFILTLILALALNAPVTWLERKKLSRGIATLLVFAGLLAVVGLLGWLVVPRLIEEIPNFLNDIPEMIESLADRMTAVLGGHPEIERQLSQTVEWIFEALAGLWRYSTTIVASVVLGLFVVALLLYMVANPRPLLRTYVMAMPPRHRDAAERAFARASIMVVGWVASNVILGSMKAVASYLFLTFMGVPGAILWSVLALFSALIPRLGFYLMSIPPVVVAFSVDAMTALWAALFYTALSEFLGNFVAPKIRSETMDIHPVFLLFMTLAMGIAFGVIGVLVASPVAGFVKAYFDEFYLARQPADPELDKRVEAMMNRQPGSGAA